MNAEKLCICIVKVHHILVFFLTPDTLKIEKVQLDFHIALIVCHIIITIINCLGLK